MSSVTQHRSARGASYAANRAIGLLERIPIGPGEVFRVMAAAVFWKSGRTKVDGWEILPSTFMLFREEYKVPVLAPELAAYLAAAAEHVFPVLLVIGLASRLSAAALLCMTAVIQIFVYPSAWADHAVWAAMLLYLIAHGPGRLSLDALIRGRLATAEILK
jgi:putative oxidoreductase